jgi:hypothetical protein
LSGEAGSLNQGSRIILEETSETTESLGGRRSQVSRGTESGKCTVVEEGAVEEDVGVGAHRVATPAGWSRNACVSMEVRRAVGVADAEPGDGGNHRPGQCGVLVPGAQRW